MLDNSSYQHLSLQITTTMKIAQILVETDADLNSFSYSVLALVLSTKRANVELARYFVNVDLDVNATMWLLKFEYIALRLIADED